jgi:hypothetical protein
MRFGHSQLGCLNELVTNSMIGGYCSLLTLVTSLGLFSMPRGLVKAFELVEDITNLLPGLDSYRNATLHAPR